jgi:hypothetical protein
VTVLAVGIIALIGGFPLFRRRKRIRSSEDPTDFNWKPELEAKTARGIMPGSYGERFQSFPETIHEVPGSQTAAELDGSYGKMISLSGHFSVGVTGWSKEYIGRVCISEHLCSVHHT